MLAVWLFVAFWVLLGLALFFVALRGGPAAARETFYGQSPGARRTFGMAFVLIYVGFGLALPAVLLTGNQANANAQVGGIRLTAGAKSGRELFGQHCGFCHTLAATNSIGKIGPNLDTLVPAQSLILHTILNGCLQNPSSGSAQTCLGYGTMPSDVVQGRQAIDVAKFVATVAGKE
ncbi:MAG: cytochrome c [Solirubrobacterales bacterium]|nr:cytochrome c [Solirubrobacterales bacterium]